jgi:hypothetical protein
MPTEVQPGVALIYVAGEHIADVEGKVVVYGAEEQEVVLGQDGDTKFAGIVISVTGARSESTAIGVIAANLGDNMGVVNDGVVEVVADGAVLFGDALAIGTDGKVKALTEVDHIATAGDIMLMIGRAQEDAEDGDIFKALVFARK